MLGRTLWPVTAMKELETASGLLQGLDEGDDVVQIGAANGYRFHLAFAIRDDLLNVGVAHPLDFGACQWFDFDLKHLRHGWVAFAIGAVASLTFGIDSLAGGRVGGHGGPAKRCESAQNHGGD